MKQENSKKRVGTYCRTARNNESQNEQEQRAELEKLQKRNDMVGKIMDSEKMGYAYLEPNNDGPRQDFMISTTKENMANFIGSHMYDASKITITDMCDRLILNTCGPYLDKVLDQKLCQELISLLAPIQMGEKEAGEVLEIERSEAETFFQAEDEAVTMAELDMK